VVGLERKRLVYLDCEALELTLFLQQEQELLESSDPVAAEALVAVTRARRCSIFGVGGMAIDINALHGLRCSELLSLSFRLEP